MNRNVLLDYDNVLIKPLVSTHLKPLLTGISEGVDVLKTYNIDAGYAVDYQCIKQQFFLMKALEKIRIDAKKPLPFCNGILPAVVDAWNYMKGGYVRMRIVS